MPAINTVTGRLRKHEVTEEQFAPNSQRSHRAYDDDLIYAGPTPAPQGEPTPLSAAAASEIIRFIERQHAETSPLANSGPPQWWCFRPSDGRCFGTLMDAQLNAARDRFVICRSDQLPTWDRLGRILIAADGVVTEVDA